MRWQKGNYRIPGKVEGIAEPVSCGIEVVKEFSAKVNLLSDVNWENGLTQWELQKSGEHVVAQLHPEFEKPFPAPPVNALRVESPKNFTFSTCQQVTITKEGYYDLQVEYRGADTTNVDIRLFIQTQEETKETMIHPTEHEWEIYEVKNVLCKPQIITVGIRISSPPVYGLMRRFSLFTSQEAKER